MRKKSKTKVDNDWDPPHVQRFHGTPPNHHKGTRKDCAICKARKAKK